MTMDADDNFSLSLPVTLKVVFLKSQLVAFTAEPIS